MELIYILLPVYNRKEITKKFVKCLKNQTYKNYHLILIDDGSTDGTAEMVKEEINNITLISGKGNWWWAGSLQQGYKWLKNQTLNKDDYVLIINDDTEFDNLYLETAVSILRDSKRTLLLSQCYNRDTFDLIDAGVHVNWRSLKFISTSTKEEINCLSTRGLFLRIEDLFEIGGFHPKILPHYLSDYEFTIRAYRKGMKLLTLPEPRLYLDESTTGYHCIKADSLLEYLKQYFSKKSAANPLYWTSFIALACPFRWKLLNWVRVWKGALYQIGYYLRNRNGPNL